MQKNTLGSITCKSAYSKVNKKWIGLFLSDFHSIEKSGNRYVITVLWKTEVEKIKFQEFSGHCWKHRENEAEVLLLAWLPSSVFKSLIKESIFSIHIST